MKARLFLGLFMAMLADPSVAQVAPCTTYDCAMAQAKLDFKKRNYAKALKGFTAAEAFDLSKAEEVDKEIAKIFDAIEKQKIDAQNSAEQATMERKKATNAEKKALDVVNQIYFYKDRFGLSYDKDAAYGEGAFGFIDKNQKIKIDFIYLEATPFDAHTGYAKVKRSDYKSDGLVTFLIDTLGNEYKLATQLRELEPKDTSITALDLSNTKLKTLPPSVYQQKQLKILLLCDNNLLYLSDSLSALTNLVTLFVDGNDSLMNIFIDFRNLTKLQNLDLGKCKLSHLPLELFELPNLQNLDISSNSLTQLPTELGKLTQLRTLNASGNRIKGVVPIELFNLKNLRELNLNNNKLISIPREIGQLTHLQILDMKGNSLTTLPSEIGKLTNLRELNLKNNQLTSLPVEIGKLTRLEVLKLYTNQLSDLPANFFKLTNLRTLDLGVNKFTVVPTGISKLSNLHTLYLNNNKISDLSLELFKLSDLRVLDLSENNLMRISLKIAQLANIQSLNLAKNQLVNVPIELGQLSRLQSLNLSENKLTSLPAELKNLSNLQYLLVDHNKLTALPESFCKFKDVKKFNFSANPLGKKPDCLNNFVGETPKEIEANVNPANAASQTARAFFDDENYKESYKAALLSTELDTTDFYKFYNLSFYALFVGENQMAIEAAQKTLQLSPTAVDVETNLALGYLLSNQYDKAEAIYRKWKGKKFLDTDEDIADKAFIKDIEDLEAAGIECPYFGRIMKFLLEK
jgi:Leucine-rich repeat (LRR) protein